MLYITVEDIEMFDEATNTFIPMKGAKLQLEHSLVSVSKWESKHHKSFLKNMDKLTPEELISYIECMNMTQNVNPDVFKMLSSKNLKDITDYINDPMTATVINEKAQDRNYGRKQTVTAELIYSWMVGLQIPVEFQKWHLNRLLTLIRVCSIQNSPKKMSKSQAMARNKMANARHRHH